MKAAAKSLLLVSAIAFGSGCAAETPAEYFADNMSGKSSGTQSAQDYGVYKSNAYGVQHVMTVHGFYDDADVCQQLIESFFKDSPGYYDCKALN